MAKLKKILPHNYATAQNQAIALAKAWLDSNGRKDRVYEFTAVSKNNDHKLWRVYCEQVQPLILGGHTSLIVDVAIGKVIDVLKGK